MTMRPLIAVPGRRSAKSPITRRSVTLATEPICEAVWAAGGEPVVLHGPDADPGVELPGRLARYDGLVMPGGADVNPVRYGRQPAPETVDWVDHQDAFDIAVTRAVLDTGLPMLAICRGMQVLNVVLGGTLVQHLPPSGVQHRGSVHDAEVVEGSRLHAIVGTTRVPGSSYHHQAVDVVGTDLVVTARADDGVIEALEHTAGRVIGVQWHPEDLHASSATDLALFADLVERAARLHSAAVAG